MVVNKMIQDENHTLYTFKMIAAIAVVFIHCAFPELFGIVVKNIARFAVPFFFIISGYFWKFPNLDKNGYYEKGRKRLRKVVRLTIYAMIVYFVFNLFRDYIQGHLSVFLSSFFSIENLTYFLLLNHAHPFLGVGHLWYIIALIYIYILIICIERKEWWNVAYKISCIFILSVFVLEFVNNFTRTSIPIFFYRNWLLTGFPLFTFGRYLKENEDKLKRIGCRTLVMAYSFFIVTETFLFKSNFELMPSSLLACVLLMKISCENKNIKFYGLSSLGKKYSQWMYIYHYLFIIIFKNLLKLFDGIYLLHWLLPLVVVFVSFIFSHLTMKINEKIVN